MVVSTPCVVRASHDSSVYAKKMKPSWKYWLWRSIVVQVVKRVDSTVGIEPVPVRCRSTALTITRGRALLLYCSTSIIWYKMSADSIFNGNYNQLHWNLGHLHQTDTSKCNSVKFPPPPFQCCCIDRKNYWRRHTRQLLLPLKLLATQTLKRGEGSIGSIIIVMSLTVAIYARIKLNV